MTDLRTHRLSTDVELVYHELGEGRPVVLLHGFLAGSRELWVRSGIAERLAADGRRVLMPDFRGHGDSASPHDAAAYPRDVLATDTRAVLDHLALEDYDLVGYSLGGRIAARLLALGAATPRRAVIGGTGLEPIVHASLRGDGHRRFLKSFGTFAPGSPEAQNEAYAASIGADPVALLHVLDRFADTPIEALNRITVPTLVLGGDDDAGRGSFSELAAAIPGGQLRMIRGDHLSAFLSPAFSDALAAFLAP